MAASMLNSCYTCDPSGAPIGYPSPYGDDEILNTSRGVYSQCSAIPDPGLQTYFIRLRNTKETIRVCASYTPACNDPNRLTTCTESCTVPNYQKVTRMPKFGGTASPHTAPATNKQYLNDTKRGTKTIVRGPQMSAASFIRGRRPVYAVYGKQQPTAATSMHTIMKYRSTDVNQSFAKTLECCSGN